MSADIKKWKRLHRETVLNSSWLRVYKDSLHTPGGAIIDDFFTKEERDWACIVAVTPSNHVVLVEQYRPGCDEVCLELPAGTIDGEDGSAAAACLRELTEETGFTGVCSADVVPLGRLYCDPNRDTNCAYGFFVRLPMDHPTQTQQLDHNEDIAVRLLPLEDLRKLAMGENGEYLMLHGTQITFMLRALNHIDNQAKST